MRTPLSIRSPSKSYASANMVNFVYVSFLVVLCSVLKTGAIDNWELIDRFLQECLKTGERFSCLSRKAAILIEKSTDRDFPLLEGINLVRNQVKPTNRFPKSLDGFTRFGDALSSFLDTHTVQVGFGEGRASREGFSKVGPSKDGGEGQGGGGIFNMKSKEIRKEAKYYRYAFLVLLGIFGLTGPLFMKTLAVIAAHSLMAAKAALIIVGGVALKKIFESKDDKKSKIKITRIPLDEIDDDDGEHHHDRYGFASDYLPYGYKNYFMENSQPYSSYYDDSKDASAIYESYHKPEHANKKR